MAYNQESQNQSPKNNLSGAHLFQLPPSRLSYIMLISQGWLLIGFFKTISM